MEQKVHLKGINGLRALAALSVVVFHLNKSLQHFHLSDQRDINLAGFGVTIFFSISGFLITFLLLKEKEGQPINIKNFYIRRALRIWPLYFLFLGLSILTAYVYNSGPITASFWFYIFFAANIPFILDTTLPFLGHFWSIGVEEQFYLFWPWLIKLKKNTLFIVVIFTSVYFSLRLLFRFIEYRFGYPLPYLAIHVTRFDCMSTGAIGAVLFYRKNLLFFKTLMHPLSQIISWGIIILLIFNKYHIASVADQLIVSGITVCLIVNMSSNPKTFIKMNGPLFDFLGKISYGIYIVHQLVIFYFALLINQINLVPEIKFPVIYCGVIGFTILIAYLSYTFFEKRFLLFKERFAIIKSANSKDGI